MEGCRELSFRRMEKGAWRDVDGAVIREGLVRLHVNGQELVSLMCTPRELDWLALGFLRSEGIIESRQDVRLLKVCPSEACVDVWLRRPDFVRPRQVTVTSGCGGGVTFADLSAGAPRLAPAENGPQVPAGRICELIVALSQAGHLYRAVRGVHTAALARPEGDEGLFAVAEDVGRHNTLDKLWGRCLAQDIPTAGAILLSTGRISSEMLFKAARMGTPIVASRTSPTDLSVALAEAWNLTLIGYARHDSLNVYTGRERLVADGGWEG